MTMDDRDLEELLRRYKPGGPPPELRARIVSTSLVRRTWPWAAAAAALLALTIGVHASAGRTQNELFRSLGQPPSTGEAFRALREVATDDEIALAELVSRIERAEIRPVEAPAWP